MFDRFIQLTFPRSTLVLLALASCSKVSNRSTPAGASSASAPAVPAAPAPAIVSPPEPRMLSPLAPAFGKHGELPAGRGVAKGQQIPDVSAIADDGRRINLRQAAAQQPLLLVFYRGGFCPFANFQLRGLGLRAASFAEKGVQLMLVTTDDAADVAATKASHGFKVPILLDSDRKVIRAFNVEHAIDERDQADAAKHNFALPKGPDGGSAIVSMPAAFVVDRAGIVRFAHADTLSGRMMSVDQLLDGVTQGLASAKP